LGRPGRLLLGQVYSEVEKTMIELERTPLVLEVGRAFQDAREGRLVAEIERLSGRRVESFVSTHHSDKTSAGPVLPGARAVAIVIAIRGRCC
jgi:hypothetical protein